MADRISTKNTKSEIIQAYDELLKKVREKSSDNLKAKKEKEEKRETVKHASGNSHEKIVKNIADLKLSVTSILDGIEGDMIGKFKGLNQLEAAIQIENRRLEELYDIKVNADTLAALLMAQKEKKLDFEMEMDAHKKEWENEQREKEAIAKEESKRIEMLGNRKEEEYEYNLKLARKKENDAYQEKKAVMEKELAERKAAVEKELSESKERINAQEREFTEMRSKVEGMAKEIENAVKEAEKAVTETLETKHKHSSDVLKVEIEGERKLNKQLVDSLEKKIKEQDAMIRHLTEKADIAGGQVKEIAVKAVEGASRLRIYDNMKEEHQN